MYEHRSCRNMRYRINVAKKLFFASFIFCSMNALVQAQNISSESRGELLYSTHCNACHSSVVHWRKQKLATDWESLKVQISRWQAFSKLNWSEEDIADVALYLNIHFYNFISTEPKALTQDNLSKLILCEY
jgi:hypothetical protein